MSNGTALKTAAFVSALAAAAALSGCSSLGGLGLDRSTTGSIGDSPRATVGQPMPKMLGAPVQVAAGPYIPPNDIGGPSRMGPEPVASGGTTLGSVKTQDLPVLTSSVNGSNPMTPAAQPLSPPPAVPQIAPAAAPQLATANPGLVSVPKDAYVHVIESGESLYTIARRYNVTAQSIIQANGFSSPDKIYVGQKIVIPGKATELARLDAGRPAAAPAAAGAAPAAPQAKPVEVASLEPGAKAAPPAKVDAVAKPKEQASAGPLVQPKVEPVLSGADKFRWPVSGRVITDFINSGTGIDIEAPEGTAVRATENGQVIYAGSGVEGYGNLVLIRHPNGFVSAYAHLQAMNVGKGDVVNRGDSVGTVGNTGTVSKAQLHFELRKGATPVDPIPLLAS
jgi:murein DD-endopeptidase MepM/ murein hydrolase activator NlpD